MLRRCRTCFEEVKDFNFLPISEINDASKIRAKLSECIPEMVIDRVVNPILCTSCVASLQSAYEFKTRCLLTEQHILDFIETKDHKTITLEEIYQETKNIVIPKFYDMPHTSTELVDDLNNLLDGVLQNQHEVLDKQTENQNVIEIDDDSIDAYSSDEDVDTQNNLYQDEQDENLDLNKNPMKQCFVKLRKLADELFEPVIPNSSGVKNFKCPECDFSTEKRRNIKKHEARVHRGEDRFACELCDYHCRNKSLLKCHMKTHLLPYKCNLCKYQSKRKDHYRNHLLTHNLNKERTFGCKLCDYKGIHLSSLQQHMRSHREKSFICNVCETAYHSNTLLKEHMSSHTGEKPFACTVCLFKTRYKSNLSAHMKHQHSETLVSFTCNICNQSLSSKKYLNRHMLIHTGEKPFACKMCKFETASNERLKEHLRTHTGEKPFSCELCGLRFAFRTNLRRHRNLHNKNPNALVCNICEYKCKSEFRLNSHLKAHKSKNSIKCPACKYITVNHASYELHLETHSMEKS